MAVVKYVDLEEDIMRIVNGEKTPIFTVDPITDFNFRSVVVVVCFNLPLLQSTE